MKLSRCKIAVLCCLLIAPMLLASCARRGAGEAETATQRAEYTGNRTDLWDEEKNPPYTGDAWVPPGGDEPESPDPDEPEEPEEPDDPGDPTPELPDFDNAEFVILSSADGFFVPEDWLTENAGMETGDALLWRLFERNTEVEDTLNVSIRITKANDSGILDLVRNSTLAGNGGYHMVSAPLNVASALSGEGLYMNLYELPDLQLNQPWWNQNFIDSAELNGKLPMVTGAISLSLYRASYITLLNMDCIEENEIDSIVERGEWTIEKYEEYCRLFTNYYFAGAVGSTYAVAAGFRHGLGVELTVREADGKVLLRNLEEKTLAAMNRLSELCYQSESMTVVSDTDEAVNLFSSQPIALLVGRVWDAERIWDDYLVLNCGILPMPKLDSSQTAYSTGASLTHGTVAVPDYRDALDTDMVGAVLEELCVVSEEKVLPIYFTKYTSRQEDMELLKSLQQMLRWDFMDVYCSQFGNSTYWENAFRQNSSISSVYAAERSLMEERLNKLQF